MEYDGSNWKLHPLPDFSHVVTVESSPDGRIYVGGNNEFGYLTRDATGQMNYTSLRSTIANDIDLNEIWQIVFHDGDVFFQSYQGLVQFNGETAKILPMEHSWFLPIGDEMYVHSWDSGLARLTGDSLIFVNKDLRFDSENTITTLKGFGSEKLLFTEYSGVYVLDTITFESRKWDVPGQEEIIKDGLYDALQWNDSLYLLTTISNGLKWMNNKGEIVKTLTKEEMDATQYGRAHKDSRGNVWLPAEGIHHIIWPENQEMGDFNTLIRSVMIGDSVYAVNSSKGFFESDVSAPLNSAMFSFSSPGFDKTDLQYSYKLEGFEMAWSEWTDNINKSYTNLEGGTYMFWVKSRIVGGEESSPAYLTLFVPTLWYRTGWAYAGGSFLVWLLIVGAFRYRTNRLKTHNKELEDVVQERTKELRERNEELKHKNKELDNFVHRVSHDLIAPLRSIKGLVNITRSEETKEGRDECFDLMESSVDKQEEFIKSILEHSVNYNQDVDHEDILLKDLCAEIIKELTYFEGAQKIEFKCQFKDDFQFNSDPSRVKIVLSNLINNAVKYHNIDQPNPEITVTARSEYEKTVIEVIDNGQGIEKEKLPEIFNMFFRATSGAQGTGLGLYIVKDAMKKLNGTITVSSEAGKGTTFRLVFT